MNPDKETNQHTLEDLRIALEDVRLIIVDEMSMLPAIAVYWIHRRLCEVKPEKSNVSFAGYNICFIGDVFQLPPIRRSPIYSIGKEETESAKTIFGKNLFANIPYIYVLFGSNRQSDNIFVDVLNRVRVGRCTLSDVNFSTNSNCQMTIKKQTLVLLLHIYILKTMMLKSKTNAELMK